MSHRQTIVFSFFVLAITLIARSAAGQLSVSAGSPTPQPAFTAEWITATVTASGAQSAGTQADYTDGYYYYEVVQVECRALSTDPWTDVTDFPSAWDCYCNPAGTDSSTTTFYGEFFWANHWKITIECIDADGEVAYTDLELVAGNWQAVSPDATTPSTPVNNSTSTSDYSGMTYLQTIQVCQSSWCKAWCWGTDPEWWSEGPHTSEPSGGTSIDSGQASWNHEMIWYPTDSSAVNTNFDWSTDVETDYKWDLNLRDWFFFGPEGSAQTTGHSYVDAYPHPGSGSGSENYSFDVSGTQHSTWNPPSISFGTGGAEITVDAPSSSNSWNSPYVSVQATPNGSITSSSNTSVLDELEAHSSINWSNDARGPQQALAQSVVDDINLAVDSNNPRAGY